MTDEEQVLEFMKARAEAAGVDVTDNGIKIARAKCRFFGIDNWQRCPCDPDSDRACISEHCKQDIEKDGICHCHCYKLKEK